MPYQDNASTSPARLNTFASVVGGSPRSRSVCEVIGPMLTITLGGVVCLLGGIVFALRLPRLRAHVRPIYIERGILAAAEIEGGSKSL